MTYIVISLFFVIFIYLITYAYIKITYKFWAYQPVFHVYNLYYWIFPPGIIEHHLPEKNKFTNTIDIVTFSNIKDNDYSDALKILQNNYLNSKKSVFSPTIDKFKPYYVGNFDNSYFSFYEKKTFLTDNNNIIEDKSRVGFISSRPLHVFIDGNYINVNYVDWLCVNKKHRKDGIAPQLIQTHVYNTRHHNKNISVWLFKREADLTGIVPITIYYNYIFDILKWKKPQFISTGFNVFEINTTNLSLLYDLIKVYLKDIFNLYIIPEYSNIIELLKTKNYFIYCCTLDNKIVGFYCFKDTCTNYKKFNIIDCFSSVCINPTKYKTIFVSGFHSAIMHLFKSQNFKYLSIENISHNYLIIQKIILSKKPVFVSPSAFYFYNFAYTPISPHNFFAIY
uniref:glycylpeptide N-tetradecanoyltransferase n=1 Tax=viral metagenome TaxID=1070528 RepID=A0A6C0BS62_9ZZZZ